MEVVVVELFRAERRRVADDPEVAGVVEEAERVARRAALGLYALVLFASTVWALWEVGLDWWQLVPRLALLFAIVALVYGNPTRDAAAAFSRPAIETGSSAAATGGRSDMVGAPPVVRLITTFPRS